MNFLYEGGNAVSGVGPIRSEDTLGTLKDIETKILKRFLGLGKDDYAALGSTGKKLPGQSSGDIDIAIDIKKIASNLGIDVNLVGDAIVEILDSAYPKMEKNYMKGLGIISIAYPIKGSSGNVQVDLMLSDDINFASFMFHSPDFTKNESKWKGLYRTELLKSIVHAVHVEEWSEYFDEYPELKKKVGRIMLDPSKGLKKNIKSFEGKNGQPVKVGKTIIEEFISKDPEYITKALLGPNAKIKDTNSFETIIDAMNSKDFPFSDKKTEILKYFKGILETKGLPIPDDIK